MRTGIALGSNIGDRITNLRVACEHLGANFGKLLCSSVYETEPVGCEPGSDPYLNAVVEFEYQGQPAPLLERLQSVEKLLGRPSRRPRNAPRTIDLDILYLGDLTFTTEEILIPHPRLHLRRFVLAPLCEIRPELILPGHEKTVLELLRELPAQPRVEPIAQRLE